MNADPAARGRGDDMLSLALIAARLILLAAFLRQIAAGNLGGPDVFRFQALARAPGLPYRDFPVEYAPLETAVVVLSAAATARATAVRLALLALASDIAAFAAVRAGWGRRAAMLYLLIGLPLFTFILQRIDLLSVALAAGGLALARRGRERAGGMALAAAVLTKLWPVVLIPALLFDRRPRTLRWCIGSLVAGAGSWLAWSGLDGYRQVLTFRGATGWEVGGTVGAIVWAVTGERTRLRAGAARVGRIPGWAPPLLLAALVASLLAIWRRARALAAEPAGMPALAAVAALLVLSPVFSIQYASWILPWAAVAAAESRRRAVAPLAFAVAALTSAVDTIANSGAHDPRLLQGLTIGRAAILAAFVAMWLREKPPS